ncbi:MAG TPA: glycosyltransferase [Vicinamibacterales bacterium]|nr:glycosyltransferase [Vicinamibacterales bacterium]
MSSSSTEAASTGQPLLSVVVVAFNDQDLLSRCLTGLTHEITGHDVEALVVSDWQRPSGRPSDALRSAFHRIRWIEAPRNSTVPRMRAMGVEISRGDIVALIEDDCIVQRGWYDALVSAHRTSASAVGGAVEPGAYRRGLDWAVYFCDYGRFMLPLAAGPAVALAGNNMSYKRDALMRLPSALTYELLEVFVHEAWQRDGTPMRTDPAVVVTNAHSWTLADVTRIPYHHARAFAGRRLSHASPWRRRVMGVAALAFPVLKVLRVVREVALRRRRFVALCRALPWVVVLAVSWSIGESVGYLSGPGESASQWR